MTECSLWSHKAVCLLAWPDEDQEESGTDLTDGQMTGDIEDQLLQLTGFHILNPLWFCILLVPLQNYVVQSN